MNLLGNKNHKGGEYILKTKIDTENFYCTSLPAEKKKKELPLGNLIKITLIFGNKTWRFYQNCKSFAMQSKCNAMNVISLGIRYLMTMEQMATSWRLLRALHWLPDASHSWSCQTTSFTALSFTGTELSLDLSRSERTWTRGGWLHVEQSSYCTEKCTSRISCFESSLEWRVQLLWSSGNAASPFPSQRCLCLSLDPFRALHESVSNVEGPFHVVWGVFHLNFSRFQMLEFGAVKLLPHQLLWL